MSLSVFWANPQAEIPAAIRPTVLKPSHFRPPTLRVGETKTATVVYRSTMTTVAVITHEDVTNVKPEEPKQEATRPVGSVRKESLGVRTQPFTHTHTRETGCRSAHRTASRHPGRVIPGGPTGPDHPRPDRGGRR